MSKCQTMNKNNKIANSRLFGEPLYDILYKFYRYIVYDINDLNIALCTNTLDNFSLLYSKDLKKCLKTFFENVNFHGKQK